MDDNVRRVLQLLQEGKITAEQAEALISALSAKSGSSPSSGAEQPSQPAVQQEGVASSPAVRLATGDLLLQIAEDPAIPEHEKLSLIIHATALICTVMALQPIPGVDVFILTPIQVASVMAMSHVMGAPIGRNGAGEIVASVVGVVGWGVVAEQFVLAGAKLLFPLFGGITLIPLIYAASYGLSWAARAVLDARRSDRKLSDSEIKKIKEAAEQRARAQKRDWSLAALKAELDDWRGKAESFKRYETDCSSLFQRQQMLQQEIDQLGLEASVLARRKMELESRLQSPVASEISPGEGERSRAELDAVDREWRTRGMELDRKGSERNGVVWRLETLVQGRFAACYPAIRFDLEAMDAVTALPYARLHALERQISLLQFEPTKADYQGDPFEQASGYPIRKVRFDDDGRLYVGARENSVVVHGVGSRLTEDQDLSRLKRSLS